MFNYRFSQKDMELGILNNSAEPILIPKAEIELEEFKRD